MSYIYMISALAVTSGASSVSRLSQESKLGEEHRQSLACSVENAQDTSRDSE